MPVETRSPPAGDYCRRIPIAFDVYPVKQNRLEPVTRYRCLVLVKRLEWRRPGTRRERHQDCLERRLMACDAANACRDFVGQEQVLLLDGGVIQGGNRGGSPNVNGADVGKTLHKGKELE